MRTWLINVLINIGTGIALAYYFEPFRAWASDNILVVLVAIFALSIVLTIWIESSNSKKQLEKEKRELESLLKQDSTVRSTDISGAKAKSNWEGAADFMRALNDGVAKVQRAKRGRRSPW